MNNKRVRVVVWLFAVYLVLVFLQTSYRQIGTISSALSLAALFVAYFADVLQGRIRISFSREAFPLLLLGIELLVVTTFRLPEQTITILKTLPQIILCYLLFSVQLDQKEFGFLRFFFLVFASVFAILVIRACLSPGSYIHDKILLFGAQLDPNFVGIPLVVAAILSLDSFLRSKNWLFGCAFILYTVAIIYTASRGSSLALVLGVSFLVFTGLRRTKRFSWFFSLIIIAAVIIIGDHYFGSYLSDYLDRLIDVGGKGDNGRFALWEKSIANWEKHPLFGNGIESSFSLDGKADHNTYLQLLSDSGIFGFVMFCAVIVRLLIHNFKHNVVMGIVLLALSLQIAFLNTLSDRSLWAILSWCALTRFVSDER